VQLSHDDDALYVRVSNDGLVLAPDFNFSTATGLGLSIVRTLVTTELAGTIQMRAANDEDAKSIGMPTLSATRGTVVDLRVPVDAS
jgi:two-component sensor histidine kinase